MLHLNRNLLIHMIFPVLVLINQKFCISSLFCTRFIANT